MPSAALTSPPAQMPRRAHEADGKCILKPLRGSLPLPALAPSRGSYYSCKDTRAEETGSLLTLLPVFRGRRGVRRGGRSPPEPPSSPPARASASSPRDKAADAGARTRCPGPGAAAPKFTCGATQTRAPRRPGRGATRAHPRGRHAGSGPAREHTPPPA